MSQLDNSTASLKDSISIEKQNGTKVTLGTEEKYVEKNIELTLNVQSGSVTMPSPSITANPSFSFNSSTGVVTATTSASQTLTPTVSAGWVGSVSNGTATVSGSNTYNLGIASITSYVTYNGLNTYFNPGTSSDKDVTLTPYYTNTAGYLTAHTTAQPGIADYYKIKTASPSFTGGSVTGSTSATGSNCSISDSTNSSGVYITAAGSASRAAVTYSAAATGWINKSSGTTALTAGSATALTSSVYYINGVTIEAPSNGSRSFTVTVPKGENEDPLVVTFVVDSENNIGIFGSDETVGEVINASGVSF